jgi:hypothetical protein
MLSPKAIRILSEVPTSALHSTLKLTMLGIYKVPTEEEAKVTLTFFINRPQIC